MEVEDPQKREGHIDFRPSKLTGRHNFGACGGGRGEVKTWIFSRAVVDTLSSTVSRQSRIFDCRHAITAHR